VSSRQPPEPLNLEVLNDSDCNQDADEPPVVPEVLEHIEISLANLSAVDLVSYLQEDKGAEDEGEESELVLGVQPLFMILFALCHLRRCCCAISFTFLLISPFPMTRIGSCDGNVVREIGLQASNGLTEQEKH